MMQIYRLLGAAHWIGLELALVLAVARSLSDVVVTHSQQQKQAFS